MSFPENLFTFWKDQTAQNGSDKQPLLLYGCSKWTQLCETVLLSEYGKIKEERQLLLFQLTALLPENSDMQGKIFDSSVGEIYTANKEL